MVQKEPAGSFPNFRAFCSPSCGFEESQPEKRPSQNSVNGVRFGIDPAGDFLKPYC